MTPSHTQKFGIFSYYSTKNYIVKSEKKRNLKKYVYSNCWENNSTIKKVHTIK